MNLRLVLALLAGLVTGGVAVTLFRDSLPPPQGSAEARAVQLETDLARATSRIARLEAQIPKTPVNVADTARDTAADIIADLKSGRPVDIERLYQRIKPALREITPVFDLLRRREQKKEFARIAAHMGEAYHLDAAQQKALENWLGERALADAETFQKIAYGENSRLEDIIKASKYQKPKKDLDAFMERTLAGNDLDRYKTDRLKERTQNLENEANNRLQRLHQAVPLDEAQQDQAFAIMVRSSPEFDSAIKLDIPLGNDVRTIRPGQDREQELLRILRPDQRAQFEAYRKRQLAEAQQSAAEIGLKLPADWDVFEDW